LRRSCDTRIERNLYPTDPDPHPLRELAQLERCRDLYGDAGADRKLALLRTLATVALRTADEVRRLHEALCFLQAYPDDARVLRQVDRMLSRFDRRPDLQTHRDGLAYSGIAGTLLWFPFFYPTARWIAARWPDALTLDRTDREAGRSIAKLLPALVSPIEAHALREAHLAGYEAIDRLRGARTDATFLIECVAAMPGTDETREAFYDLINPSCELAAAAGTPSRTHARFDRAPRAWQSSALRRNRPDLHLELHRPPRSIRIASLRDAAALLRLAREAMITRQRDLDAFAYGNQRDVWLADDGDGLTFALIGMVPERRAALAAIYGGLTLQNGVPIGYHQADLFGRSAAISFNTFDTFRGGESAYTFARLLATLRFAFGVTSFSIEPFQLGQRNDEGLRSAAWWFYAKMGFHPRDARIKRLAEAESNRVHQDPRHRTSLRVLRRLATRHLFFDADPADPAPLMTPESIGLRAGAFLASLAPEDRDRALKLANRRARKACGLRSLEAWSKAERRAWDALCPLIAMLQVDHWSRAERQSLIALVKAKAAQSERGYAQKFAQHTRLQHALAQFAGAL
jgi:hypothetical protein